MFWSMNMLKGIKINLQRLEELPIQHKLQLSRLISKSSICSNKHRETGQLPISTAKIAPKAISSAWNLVSFLFLDTKNIHLSSNNTRNDYSSLQLYTRVWVECIWMEVIYNLQKLNILRHQPVFFLNATTLPVSWRSFAKQSSFHSARLCSHLAEKIGLQVHGVWILSVWKRRPTGGKDWKANC